MLSEGYRRVLMPDVCWVLQSRCEAAAVEKSSTPATYTCTQCCARAKAVEEEEGIHHDQRFEPAGLLLAEALQFLCPSLCPSARLLQGDRIVFATCI